MSEETDSKSIPSLEVTTTDSLVSSEKLTTIESTKSSEEVFTDIPETLTQESKKKDN